MRKKITFTYKRGKINEEFHLPDRWTRERVISCALLLRVIIYNAHLTELKKREKSTAYHIELRRLIGEIFLQKVKGPLPLSDYPTRSFTPLKFFLQNLDIFCQFRLENFPNFAKNMSNITKKKHTKFSKKTCKIKKKIIISHILQKIPNVDKN